ncbi:hypothetical protein A8B81_07240 [Sulfitobacter pontiacus]|uniref:Panacea domain-containing protein n=1 Tax=Sulfitobacter pontiacus TaxID=60137 RepID=UPI0007D91246|nr:Panacea domain-containing protein [Sulfitobacter pontiacus]OAN73889.1 hypothetical protein A8B81_07240 [Sulfitobacter pontiacus]
MSSIADIVAYIAEHYPHKSELSKARLTKMVYLADWQAVKQTGKQLTPIRWYFHNFGPYVDDVVNAAREDSRLKVQLTRNAYGDFKEEIKFSSMPNIATSLTKEETKIIDSVMSETQTMYWKKFIEHVYDTTPVKKSQRYSYLKLEEFV